ncbi:DUF4054 domain-containing protein [Acidaminococcus fermentans]|uniref:DUF4054 domain-containing protein n=1 Tax=Acidaminococcus fermentans TaxID=905 RepID=UPI00345F0BCD
MSENRREQDESAGDLSVSYDFSQVASDFNGWGTYKLTVYGQQFVTIRNHRPAGFPGRDDRMVMTVGLKSKSLLGVLRGALQKLTQKDVLVGIPAKNSTRMTTGSS